MEKFCEVYQRRSSLTLYLIQCLLFLGVGYIFLTYSASATDENYCLGMLVADADSDILKPSAWKKT